MNKIFWHQSKEVMGSNKILNNEEELLLLDGNNIQAQELFDSLYEIQDKSRKIFSNKNLLIRKYKNKGYFFSSNFTDLDELSRKIAFMFYTESNDANDIIMQMNSFAEKIDKNYESDDISNIKEQFQKKKNNQKILNLIIILIIIGLTYLIIDKLKN